MDPFNSSMHLLTSRVPSLWDFVILVLTGCMMLFEVISENHKTTKRGFSGQQYKQLCGKWAEISENFFLSAWACVLLSRWQCDWEYLCNEIYYRLGSVWFGKRVLFPNVSMHLALTRPSEIKWEFQNTWSCKSDCPCIWGSIGMFILKLEKQTHWRDPHTDG